MMLNAQSRGGDFLLARVSLFGDSGANPHVLILSRAGIFHEPLVFVVYRAVRSSDLTL